MKLVVAGGRTFTNKPLLFKTLDSRTLPQYVISGTAEGADSLGEEWARERNIPIIFCPAYCEVYGKAAGYHRNKSMSLLGDELVAFWDGKSRGTKMMIELMREQNKPVTIINY